MADKGAVSSTTKPKPELKTGIERKQKVVELTTSVPSLNPPTEPGQQVEQDSPEDPVSDNATKIFVGNLPYDTTEDQLTELFGAVGEIVEVTMPSTQRRPMGFGFVTFKTADSVNMAIEKYDKSRYGSRVIAVEQAIDKSSSFRSYRGRRGRSRGRGGHYSGYAPRRGGSYAAPRRYHDRARIDDDQQGSDSENNIDNEDGNAEADINLSDSTSHNQDEPSQAQQNEDSPSLSDKGAEDPNQYDQDDNYERVPRYGQSHPGRGRGRGLRGRGRGGKGRERGRGILRRNYDEGPHSPTTLFVTNLPFDISEDELSKLFDGYKVVSVTVMRYKDGASRGYGFVELESHKEQSKVLGELQELTVSGRTITVKPALQINRYSRPPRQINGEVAAEPSNDDPQEELQQRSSRSLGTRE